MRYLFVSNFECIPNSGSAGSILAIGEALVRRDHQVDYEWKRDWPYRFANDRLREHLELPRWQLQQVDELLRRAPYDVVVISQPFCYLVYETLPAKYPRTLFLNRSHGWEERLRRSLAKLNWENPFGLGTRMARKVTTYLEHRACVRTARSCHGLIAACNKCADFVVGSYGIPRERVAAIPYGVGEEFLAAAKKECPSGLRLLFAGNYIPRKGTKVLETLLPSIASRFPDFTLTFVIQPEAIPTVRSLYEPMFGKRLEVVAWMSRRQLTEIYSAHDLLLSPSFFEGFNKVNMEAAACGMCIVGFDEGGTSDVLTPNSEALLCAPGDVAAFGRLIEQALSDPAEVRRRGARARSHVRQRTWADVARETEAFCLTRWERVQGARRK